MARDHVLQIICVLLVIIISPGSALIDSSGFPKRTYSFAIEDLTGQ